MPIVKINWTMPGFSVTYRVFGAIKMIAALWAPPQTAKFSNCFAIKIIANNRELQLHVTLQPP